PAGEPGGGVSGGGSARAAGLRLAGVGRGVGVGRPGGVLPGGEWVGQDLCRREYLVGAEEGEAGRAGDVHGRQALFEAFEAGAVQAAESAESAQGGLAGRAAEGPEEPGAEVNVPGHGITSGGQRSRRSLSRAASNRKTVMIAPVAPGSFEKERKSP